MSTNERDVIGGNPIRRIVNPILQREIQPRNYPTQGEGNPVQKLAQAVLSVVQEARGPRKEADPVSEDAWKLYLGLPRDKKIIEPSHYTPAKAKDEDAEYYTIPNFLRTTLERDPAYLEAVLSSEEGVPGAIMQWFADIGGLALGRAKLDKGFDDKGHYISLYDRYDFDIPLEREGKGFGRPFEIYDRVYYDPKTKALLPDPS